jgi:F-type H+-transporting ATPase subunit delta
MSLYRKEKNIVVVRLTTAQPVDEAVCGKVSAALLDSKATVEMQNIVDEGIIGGFIYETETHRLDASIRRQLRDIEAEFVKPDRKLV